MRAILIVFLQFHLISHRKNHDLLKIKIYNKMIFHMTDLKTNYHGTIISDSKKENAIDATFLDSIKN